MTGLTVGPRQFTLQKDTVLIKTSTDPAGPTWFEEGGSNWVWGQAGKYISNQTKLDLRPFRESNGSRALDLLNITLQESPTWLNGSTTVGILVTDILSTVRLTPETIQNQWEMKTAGFLNTRPKVSTGTQSTDQNLTPSQVVWGIWRYFDHDANLGTAVINRASSYFGEGEIVVAPALYWTRVVSMYSASEGSSMLIPSSNLVCHAAVIDISEGQELAQMARMAQR